MAKDLLFRLITLAGFLIASSGGNFQRLSSQESGEQSRSAHSDSGITPVVRSELVVRPVGALDTDDMCFLPSKNGGGWIIASDKKAGLVFLLDSEGKELDRISIPKPGNIDARPNVQLFGKEVPLIVVNQRDPEPQLRAMTIVERDGAPKLELMPGEMRTGPNYGGCLSLGKDGQIYFFSTTEGGEIQQFEIEPIVKGKDQMLLNASYVRGWNTLICEGAVSDDQAGFAYLTEEAVGIRKVPIDPKKPVGEEYILRVGQNEVVGDLEGITILGTGLDTGYIIASDQGRSQFIVLDRKTPHQYIGSFAVQGANNTDGVDVANYPFGKRFADGIFACHTDSDAEVRAMVLVKLSEILKTIETFQASRK